MARRHQPDAADADPAWFARFLPPWQNYQQAFSPEFIRSVWVQVELSLVTVVAQMLSALASRCCWISRRGWLEAVRTGFLIPMVLPPIVVAIIWKVLYTPDISPLHRLAAALGMPFHSLITNASPPRSGRSPRPTRGSGFRSRC